MSGGEVRHLSGEHLQVVQNLIERCIQLHMSKIEAVSVLSKDANIVPEITELVWQRLEEENQEFFQFYYMHLALKEQIKRFNELLKKQAALMGHIQSAGVAHMGVSNGSRMTQFQQNDNRYSIEQTVPSVHSENIRPAIPPNLPAPYTNGVSTMQTHTAYDMSTQSRRINFLPDAPNGQSSNSMRLMQGLDGGIIKSESGYLSDSQIAFDADTSIGEPQGLMEDASVASFSSMNGMDASSQPMHDTLLDMNGSCSSFGQLGQMPKIFSFPDLSAFPDELDNYQNSAYIATDTGNFLDKGEIQDESKGTISRSYNTYEEFGSD